MLWLQTPAAQPPAISEGGSGNPWVQLVMGIICMAMVANLQYGWTLFVNPMDAKHHWGKVAIQFAFTLFVLIETWLVPFEAYFADRYGPRPLVMIGAFLIAGVLDRLRARGESLPGFMPARRSAGSEPAWFTAHASATP